jgi:hypothetical protein
MILDCYKSLPFLGFNSRVIGRFVPELERLLICYRNEDAYRRLGIVFVINLHYLAMFYSY